MPDLSSTNRISLVIYLLITVLVIALFLDGNPTLERFELSVQDAMFEFRGERTPSGDVVICALDDATLDRTGWPLHRDSLARLLEALRGADAAVIVCNFDWRNVEPANINTSDSALMVALAGDDRVVLPLHFTYAELGVAVAPPPEEYLACTWTERFPSGSATNAQAVSGPESWLVDSASALGGITPVLDPDRVVRRSPLLVDYGGHPFASSVLWAVSLREDIPRTDWWLEAGRQVRVGPRVVPTDERGRVLLDYHGNAHTFTSYSASTFLEDGAASVSLAGKIVILDATGILGGVELATRTDPAMPAAEIMATAIENVLQQRYVRTPSYSALFDLLVLGLIGAFCAVVLPKVSLLYRFVVLGISLFVIVNMQFLVFASFGWLTNAFYPAMEVIFFMAVSPLIKSREEREAERDERARRARTRPPHRPEVPTPQAEPAVTADPEAETQFAGSRTESVSEESRTIQVPHGETTRFVQHDPTQFCDTDKDAAPTRQVTPTRETSEPSLPAPEPAVAEAAPGRPAMDATPPPLPGDPDGTQTMEPGGRIPGAEVSESGQYLGRYRVLEEIGRGAMGIVYRGVDPAINRPVALKTVRLDLAVPPEEKEELRNRLVREAQAAGQLSHPNIVTVYDVGSQGDTHYIAMEYLKGYTLERAVAKRMTLNYKIFSKLMIQVCDALEYAHSNDLVHRDVKPANIMVLDNFKVKVMDFGIARVGHSNMTQTGVALGTPSYISPEQLSGQGIDRRTDIFSLGVVMYELLTKEKPFTGENMNKLIFSILNDQPRRPTDLDNSIPEVFDRLCMKALEKDPRQRYQYAADLSRDLKEFIAAMAPQRLSI